MVAKVYKLVMDGVDTADFDDRDEAKLAFSQAVNDSTFEDSLSLLEIKEIGRAVQGVKVVTTPRQPNKKKAKA